MSRVDEAFRRAAEQAAANGEGDTPSTPALRALAEGCEEWAREPFPLEMPEVRQKPRAVTRSSPLAAFSPTLAGSSVPGPPLPDVPKSDSLMERIDGAFAEKVVINRNTSANSREQYRRLAATMHYTQAPNGLKVILISSAVPGEGKTLTAANLALTFSESYKRNVLLIDADLRRPTIHTIFQIDNTSGLSEGLFSTEERRLPVRQFSSNLAILPAGQPTLDPTAGLTSDRMRRLITEARDVFDWVVIDTPPVALLSDANLLSAICDGVVFVVKAGTTPYELAKRAVDAIGRERILGVVLNRAQQAPHIAGYGYYDYYEAGVATGAEQQP